MYHLRLGQVARIHQALKDTDLEADALGLRFDAADRDIMQVSSIQIVQGL